MSNKLSVQNPISAGQIIGAYNASSVSDTDWHSLSSDDFYDPSTGTHIGTIEPTNFSSASSAHQNDAYLADASGTLGTSTPAQEYA